MGEEIGYVFLMVIGALILFVIIGSIVGAIDKASGYELEDVTIECVITHMDIDDGSKFVTVVGINDDFALTMRVTNKLYANHTVGDKLIVVRHGYHYPMCGDVFSYEIAE